MEGFWNNGEVAEYPINVIENTVYSVEKKTKNKNYITMENTQNKFQMNLKTEERTKLLTDILEGIYFLKKYFY